MKETLARNGADRRWQAFHAELHALASTRALSVYLSRLRLSGNVTEIWELIFSAQNREANPTKRRFLLRQLAWDVAHGANGASMARALMAMVLWPHLDEFYGRFRRRFPACDLLAKFVVDALGMAACELRAELGEVRETVDTDVVDIERAILAGTLFLIGKLVGDFEIKRARLITRVDLVDPDQLDGVSAPAADSTVSLRAPLEAGPAGTEPPALALLRTLVTDPRLLRALVVALESPRTEAEPAQPRCSPSGSPLPFQSLPGSFRVAELARVLDFEHEFRFVDAGYDRHGAKLVAVAIRLPSA